MTLIGRTIKDGDVISTVRKYLVSGIKIDDEYEDLIVGTPQGNLSPLLANIMINKLDKEMEKRGFSFTVVPFEQSFKDMSLPFKRLMVLVLEKNIAHSENPVLRWMMDNIFVRMDLAGNIKLDREKITEKNDSAVAAIMGLTVRSGTKAVGVVCMTRGIYLSFN